jgi:hypothetical protein
MKPKAWIGLGAVVVVLCSLTFLGYRRWRERNDRGRGELLARMPPEASAVFFVDLAELRRAPFLAELYSWAGKPQADGEYAQFLNDTGFDYERDLDRMAIAVQRRGEDSTFFVLADGKFDREKISAYAAKSGVVRKSSGREIFSVPAGGSQKKLSFTFLSRERIALTDAPDLAVSIIAKNRDEDAAEWRARFKRLEGSPVLAVIRQEAAAGTELAAQAPGGLRSPQLSALLDQLQWITVAGKPANDGLRVVAEGECRSEGTVRQLEELLNGVVILAQAGLNDAKTRKQLDPAARAAYLELVKTADVEKIDRGETKSVRLMFEITPGFLKAFRSVSPVLPPEATPDKPLRGNSTARKKGHT